MIGLAFADTIAADLSTVSGHRHNAWHSTGFCETIATYGAAVGDGSEIQDLLQQ